MLTLVLPMNLLLTAALWLTFLFAVSSTTPVLVVRIVVVDVSYESYRTEPNGDHFECIPEGMEQSYECDLPFYFVEAHWEELKAGEAIVSIEGGVLTNEEVYIPWDAVLTLQNSRRGLEAGDTRKIKRLGQPARDLQVGIGRHSSTERSERPSRPNRGRTGRGNDDPLMDVDTHVVLVLRVTTLDAQLDMTAQEISDSIFDPDRVSFASQYRRCSYGQLEMQPALKTDYNVTEDGVLEVFLNTDIADVRRTTIANIAQDRAKELLGLSDLQSHFDHVMICMPHGSQGNWVAYAIFKYFITAYNGDFCGYVSAHMHEVGHNLGLSHSSENMVPYRDQSGYMGASYALREAPQMCFNGHKYWNLKWMERRHLRFTHEDLLEGGMVIKLGSFVDFRRMPPDVYAVVNVAETFFAQFNFAEGMNIGTRDHADRVTIVTPVTDGSDLVAALPNGDVDTFTQEYRDGDRNLLLVIRVCGPIRTLDEADEEADEEADDNVVEFVWLSIGLNGTFCNLIPPGVPTASPSLAPSNYPTVSLSPSASPSAYPTERPSLSLQPTGIDNGSMCDDSPVALFYVNQDVGLKDCTWLADNIDEWRDELCREGRKSYGACLETCGLCYDRCEDDSDAKFQVEGVKRDCHWLARNPLRWNSTCAPGNPAYSSCRETCNSCNEYSCDDSPQALFEVEGFHDLKTCIWLADSSREKYRRHLCRPERDPFYLCPETCRRCVDDCEDEKGARFDIDGRVRDCEWLSIRVHLWEDECQRREISSKCKETCDTCGKRRNLIP